MKIVTLPGGQDPADAPDGFADRLRGAESYLFYRMRLDRAFGRPSGSFDSGREFLAKAGTRPSARTRFASRRPARPPARDTGWPGACARRERTGLEDAPRLLDAGDRLERDVLAACVAHPSLVRGLTELSSDHFDVGAQPPLPRRARHRVGTTRSSRRSGPSSTHVRHRKRSTSARGRSCSSGSASGS